MLALHPAISHRANFDSWSDTPPVINIICPHKISSTMHYITGTHNDWAISGQDTFDLLGKEREGYILPPIWTKCSSITKRQTAMFVGLLPQLKMVDSKIHKWSCWLLSSEAVKFEIIVSLQKGYTNTWSYISISKLFDWNKKEEFPADKALNGHGWNSNIEKTFFEFHLGDSSFVDQIPRNRKVWNILTCCQWS